MPAPVQMPWLARQKVLVCQTQFADLLGLPKLDMVLSEDEVPPTPPVNRYHVHSSMAPAASRMTQHNYVLWTFGSRKRAESETLCASTARKSPIGPLVSHWVARGL